MQFCGIQAGLDNFFGLQSIGSPLGSSSMVGHVSDHSLSGHSHTFTFSSTEVRLSFYFPTPSCLLQFMCSIITNAFVLSDFG